MFNGNSTRQMPYVRTYDEAEKQFNQRGAVRSTKWANNERPLYKRYHKYRVVKYAEYYDLILYNTVMARYYAPTVVDGKKHERRLYKGDHSVTSRDFMSHVLGISRAHELTLPDGRRIVAPIYYMTFLHDDGANFSADYRYVDGVIDTANSAHTKHYRKTSSAEDKAERAELVKSFEPYIMLAQMRMQEFYTNVRISRDSGKPFGGASEQMFQESIIDMAEGSTDQIAINYFFELCQSTYNVLASKRGYKQKDFRVYSTSVDTIDKLEKQITPTEFRTAIVGRINRLTGADKRTEAVEIPQFVVEKDYPHTNIVFG